MAGTYGDLGGPTYGQMMGPLYGSVPATEETGGWRGPRRLTREQILRLREDEDALIFAALT